MSSDDLSPYEKRFRFLFPALKNELPRFTLHAPDLLQPGTWTVFDSKIKRTVAAGRTAENAVDQALLSTFGT